MQPVSQWQSLSLLALLALASAGAPSTATEAGASYPTIGADLEPLRAAFNADPGHVRAVLLASPT